VSAFTPLDLVVLAAYIVGLNLWGAWLGRGQQGGTDYFLGSRNLPWWAVSLSVVSTETSSLTFLSIPGVAYVGTLAFLQLTVGYLLGRVVAAVVLLPAYYKGELTTAYALIGRRFGAGARRFTSGVFIVTRLLADSVRVFATAIPLALLTGWSYPVSIAIIVAASLIYGYVGGIKSVVWVDVAQLFVYLGGAFVAMWILHLGVPGGWSSVLSTADAAGKLQLLDFRFGLAAPYTFWAGLVGGAFLSMASHGTDQLMVQRLLTCPDVRSSQAALIGSGVVVMFQFALFLVLGLGLWAFYGGATFERSDEIFALFIVEQLPSGVRGLLIAGVLAAATLSSSINSLASAAAYDFWAPAVGAVGDEKRILRAGRVFSVLWAVLLTAGAILFIPLSRTTAAVEVALAIASLVYGGLLGAFFLGVLSARADARSVIVGMATGIGVVTLIWVFLRAQVAWPWFALIGTVVTFAVGQLLGSGRPTPEPRAAAAVSARRAA
jgi:SSS family transporter